MHASSANTASLPIATLASQPERALLLDQAAVDAFRKLHKIEPARIRRMRYALYQQHVAPEEALAHLQSPFAQAALEHFQLSPLSIAERHDSAIDRSSKFVLQTDSDEKIETVLMRSAKRVTACVSTQVGCRAGCSFCATARMGLRRNLTAGEIVEQVLVAARTARSEGARLRNIVFMGMGEPLHNEIELHKAIELLSGREGCAFPMRRISVSTVGEPAAMLRLVDRFPGIQIALSLHSARPELRSRLVPWTRQIDWDQLHSAVREIATRPLVFHHQGPIMIQHIMIAGVNDGPEDADALIEYVKGFTCIVNLIPFNAIAPVQNWQPSSREHRDWFAKRLRAAGVYTTVRYSMGADVAAACGQLVQP